MNVKSFLFDQGIQSSHSMEITGPVNAHFGNLKSNKHVLKFDARLLKIIKLLREVHQRNHKSGDFSINYLVELFESELTEKNKFILIREIHNIGYEKLKEIFEKLNMECESYLCETEDLFGILKRHQFNKEIPDNDRDQLKQIIQFLHITLIHINLLHNRRNGIISEKIIEMKNQAFDTISPFVDKVEEILYGLVVRTHLAGKHPDQA